MHQFTYFMKVLLEWLIWMVYNMNRMINIEGKQIKLQIWDTAGQENNKNYRIETYYWNKLHTYVVIKTRVLDLTDCLAHVFDRME